MRRWLTVAILLGLVVVAGSAIWWMFLTSFGERQWQDLQQRLQADGYTFQYSELETSGYPLELVWTLHGVTLSHPGADGGPLPFRGEAERLRVTAKPWAPQRMAYRVESQHRWAVETGGAAGVVDVAVGSAAGTFGPQADDSGWRLETRLAGITARPRDGIAEPLRIAAAAVVLEAPLRMQRIAVDARLDRIGLPQDFGLGRTVELLSVQGEMDPWLRSGAAAAVQAWQGAGGRIAVRQAQLRFGAMDGNATGTVGLDPELRPQGDLTLTVREPNKLLALAAERGWIADGQGQWLAMGAGLLGRRNNGGTVETQLPLSFREGAVWLGPVRLADLPPVSTPSPP